MNKTSSQSSSSNIRNVPFGVFGVMLPYRTVRSTYFSQFCVCHSMNVAHIENKPSSMFFVLQADLDTGVCYIIDENGYIMFISEQDAVDRTVLVHCSSSQSLTDIVAL
jgi:hypothetical protein